MKKNAVSVHVFPLEYYRKLENNIFAGERPFLAPFGEIR